MGQAWNRKLHSPMQFLGQSDGLPLRWWIWPSVSRRGIGSGSLHASCSLGCLYLKPLMVSISYGSPGSSSALRRRYPIESLTASRDSANSSPKTWPNSRSWLGACPLPHRSWQALSPTLLRIHSAEGLPSFRVANTCECHASLPSELKTRAPSFCPRLHGSAENLERK